MKREINVTQVSDEETNSNLELEDSIETNTYKDKIGLVFMLIVGVLAIISLLFVIFLQNNKLEAEKAKPKTIAEMAKDNIKKSTLIKQSLQREIILLETQLSKKQEKLKQAEYCLEHTNEHQVVDCYILRDSLNLPSKK